MKHLLQRWEQSRSTWFLIIVCFFFFLLRLPSLFEPYWYGDEGIYETIGRALQQGRMLYTGIWDNKPPLLYVTYALFNGDQFSVEILSLLFGIGSIIFFFLLAKKVFVNLRPAYYATGVFALLFATPMTEGNIANAENFMLLPIIAAAYFVYQNKHQYERHSKKLSFDTSQFIAGLLLGFAFLYKIVAVFDFAAFGLYVLFQLVPVTNSQRKIFNKKAFSFLLQNFASYTCGFLLPIILTIFYFFIKGAGSPFIKSVFTSNFDYVNYGNAFIIPQGILIFKIIILLICVLILYARRDKMKPAILFITLWFFFEVFDSFFSQRNYTHYFLVLIPSLSLLIMLLPSLMQKQARLLFLPVILLICISFAFFIGYNFLRVPNYYGNYLSYITGQKTIDAYRSNFDSRVPRDYLIADFLHLHTHPNDTVFIWGNDPQIYVLSNTLPPGRYTVAYHITNSNAAGQETMQAIQHTHPKYIVILSDAPQLTFPIAGYHPYFSVEGNNIYERAY